MWFCKLTCCRIVPLLVLPLSSVMWCDYLMLGLIGHLWIRSDSSFHTVAGFEVWSPGSCVEVSLSTSLEWEANFEALCLLRKASYKLIVNELLSVVYLPLSVFAWCCFVLTACFSNLHVVCLPHLAFNPLLHAWVLMLCMLIVDLITNLVSGQRTTAEK